MAENYVVNGDDLTSIADAIRTKTGETEGMSVEEMPAKIMSLSNDEDINNAVSAHNTDETAHPDIRERVKALEEGSVSADLAVAIADDISREAISKHNTDTEAHPDIREKLPFIITGEMSGAGMVVNTSATLEEATAAYEAGIPVFLQFEVGGAQFMLRLSFAVAGEVALFSGIGDGGRYIFAVQAVNGFDDWEYYEFRLAEYRHTHSASEISGGTFTGTVKAASSYQAPDTALLRNTKLVSTDTTPTVNGEINWTYK